MSVLQTGDVTPGHLTSWTTSGVVQDAGTSVEGKVNNLGLYGAGGTPLAITNSPVPGPFSGNYAQMGFGVSDTAAYVDVETYGGGSALPFQVRINGTPWLTVQPGGGGSGSTGVINVLNYGALGDGVTNDTAAIQAAINAAAGRDTVLIPNTGSSYMITGITLPSNTVMQLDGTLKLIAASSPYGGSMVCVLGGANNVIVFGSGTIDGNASAQTGVAGGIGTPNAAATNIVVRGVTITNHKNWPVNFYSITNGLLDRVTMSNSGNSPGFAVNCVNCWADHCFVTGINDVAFGIYGGGSNCGITNSYISGNNWVGLFVLNDVGQPAAASNILFANNIVTYNKLSGIAVYSGTTGLPQHSGIVLSGNIVHHNNQGNAANHGGIWVRNSKNVLVANNQVSYDGNGSNGAVGIYADSYSSHVKISNNQIWNEGQGSSYGGTGIWISGVPYVEVSNNLVYDDQATPTMNYGMVGATAVGNVITDNRYQGMHTGGSTVGLSADTVARDYPSQVPTAFSPAVSMLQTSWMTGAPVSTPSSTVGATWVYDTANKHPWVYNPVTAAWEGVAPLKSTNATYQASPSNPAGTTNTTTGVMMGLAGAITPNGSGKVLMTITGNVSNATSTGFGGAVQARYGTGPAPVNGGAIVGSSFGGTANLRYTSASTSEVVPFSCTGVVTGLTLGTTYWLDLALAATGGGTATVTNLSITAVEIP